MAGRVGRGIRGRRCGVVAGPVYALALSGGPALVGLLGATTLVLVGVGLVLAVPSIAPTLSTAD